MNQNTKPLGAILVSLLSCVVLLGCASTGITVPKNDSLEGFNRAVFSFNAGVDKVLVKPLAKGYRWITPDPLERGINNMFSNLAYPTVIVNNLLQGKPLTALQDTGRFLVNSTLGIAGFIDVAQHMGMPEHNEDFDQTLAVWGVPSGPYIVLPFLGPSTLRGTLGNAADQYLHVRSYLDNPDLETGLIVLQIINIRANLLPLDEQINASNDPYIFMREAYLQNRNFNYYDGDPPLDEDFLE
ncbi:MAG: VacJ family lipoprotein, partial [Pseudomonadota bacterium]